MKEGRQEGKKQRRKENRKERKQGTNKVKEARRKVGIDGRKE